MRNGSTSYSSNIITYSTIRVESVGADALSQPEHDRCVLTLVCWPVVSPGAHEPPKAV